MTSISFVQLPPTLRQATSLQHHPTPESVQLLLQPILEPKGTPVLRQTKTPPRRLYGSFSTVS